jgi:methionine-rich copper-binding protein CopC
MNAESEGLLLRKVTFKSMNEFQRYAKRDRVSTILTALFVPLVMLSLVLINSTIIQDVNAHANPVSYSPKADTTIEGNEKLPENIVITYTERPEQKASHIRVTGSNNERVDKNNFAVSSANPRESSVS